MGIFRFPCEFLLFYSKYLSFRLLIRQLTADWNFSNPKSIDRVWTIVIKMGEGKSRESKETNVDSMLGRLVIEKNLCTKYEVEECLDVMKNLARQGQPHSLSDALVAQGYVTATQLNRMRKAIDDVRPTHRIPGYQILEKLGAGAMATVFKAKQLSLDRDVAIKVLPKRLSENPEYVERFYQEGRAAEIGRASCRERV